MLEPCQLGDPGTVGHFHILARLGYGGFGTVFAAHDHGKPGELVAVKVLRPPATDADNFTERFRREIKAIKRVKSRYVPAFVGAGPDDSPPWLATELVPGLSLFELVQSCGALADPAVWKIGEGVTEALKAINAVNLVHRDLKPGNVILVPDGPKIIDFGLVHFTEGDHSQLSRQWGAGTAEYAPPEVVTHGLDQMGLPGDVFMLGGTLLFAATKHPTHTAENNMALIYQASNAPPDLSGLEGSLAPVVVHCLSRDPALRPTLQTLGEEFARRVNGRQVFADVLPQSVHDELEKFRRQLAYYWSTCPATNGQARPADPGRAAPDPPVAWQGPGTREYTSAIALTEKIVRSRPTMPRPAPAPVSPVSPAGPVGGYRPVPGSSWGKIDWACEFGAWIQAPVTIAGGVAVAADLEGTMRGLDARNGRQRWAIRLGAPLRSAAVPQPGREHELCLGDAEGGVYSVDARSGKYRTLLHAGGAIQGSPVVSGNRVCAVSADGRLHAIDANPPASVVLLSTDDPDLSAPAATADAVFVATSQGRILAVDTRSGRIRLVASTDGRVCALPLPVGDHLYIAATDGLLQEVDAGGHQQTVSDLGAPVHAGLAHDADRLYVGSGDGVVRAFALARERGRPLTQLWVCPLGDEVRGLTVADGQVFVAAGNSVVVIDPTDGTPGPVFQVECAIAAAPVFWAGRVYVTGLGGTVFCVSSLNGSAPSPSRADMQHLMAGIRESR